MLDLPPQVPYATEQVSNTTQFGAGTSSIVAFDNESGFNLVVSIPTTSLPPFNPMVPFYPYCWVGGFNPLANLNNKTIKDGSSLRKTELMNTSSCYNYQFSFPIILTFNTSEGMKSIGLNVSQADVYGPSRVNDFYSTYKVGSDNFTDKFKITQTIDNPSLTNSFQIQSVQ